MTNRPKTELGKTVVASAASIMLIAGVATGGSIGAAAAAEMKGHNHSAKPHLGKLVIERAWARASVGKNGAAYVTIRNEGGGMDRLIGASSPVAKKVELHTHLMDKGIMRMRQIEAVEVHPGTPAVMRPGGNHIMMMGLKRKLKKGEVFPITLQFAKAGKITVSVTVKSVGASGMDHGKSMKGGKKKMKHTH